MASVRSAESIAFAAMVADEDAAVAADPNLRLMGYSVRAAVAGAFEIVNGATGAAGANLVVIELATDGAETKWFGGDGIAARAGLSTDWTDGTFDLVLYYKILS